MKKEIIICVIVIGFIVVLNIFAEKNTYKVMEEIVANLEEVRVGLTSEDEEKMNTNIQEAKAKWEKEKNLLSIYIEHEELEKVEMYLVQVETDIGTKEYSMAMESLGTCEFIVEHIKDKYKLSLKNIF